MAASILGIFSDTLLRWREPAQRYIYVKLKGEGIVRGAGKSLNWLAYREIDCCHVISDNPDCPVLKFSLKKRKWFYLLGPVLELKVAPEIHLEAVLAILRFKGVKVV